MCVEPVGCMCVMRLVSLCDVSRARVCAGQGVLTGFSLDLCARCSAVDRQLLTPATSKPLPLYTTACHTAVPFRSTACYTRGMHTLGRACRETHCARKPTAGMHPSRNPKWRLAKPLAVWMRATAEVTWRQACSKLRHVLSPQHHWHTCSHAE